MLRRLLGRQTAEVELCDECAPACDATCRADQRLDQARTQTLSARLGAW